MSNNTTTPELEQRLNEIETRWDDITKSRGKDWKLEYFKILNQDRQDIPFLLSALREALATVEKMEEHERQRLDVQQKGCVE